MPATVAADQAVLERLVTEVLASAGYRTLDPALIARIGRDELATRRSFKEAVKATKSRLHQVHGAFQAGKVDYDGWLARLREARGEAGTPLYDLRDGPPAFAAQSLHVMARHASTAERAPILDRFYSTLLPALPAVRTVLDLGCGLHPLAIPWMGLQPGTRYLGYEIDAAQVAFLNAYLALAGISGCVQVRDVHAEPPAEEADLALALKLLPTLDRLGHDGGAALLAALRVPYLVASFPDRTLGGHAKGMGRQYEARFTALVAARGWQAQRFSFPGELVFVVRTRLA